MIVAACPVINAHYRKLLRRLVTSTLLYAIIQEAFTSLFIEHLCFGERREAFVHGKEVCFERMPNVVVSAREQNIFCVEDEVFIVSFDQASRAEKMARCVISIRRYLYSENSMNRRLHVKLYIPCYGIDASINCEDLIHEKIHR